MIEFLPFMMSTLAFGVMSLVIFMGLSVIVSIPIFATRGRTQAVWFGVVSIFMLAVGVALVVLTILQSRGDINV